MGLQGPILASNDPIQTHFRSFHGQYPRNTKRNKVGAPAMGKPLIAHTYIIESIPVLVHVTLDIYDTTYTLPASYNSDGNSYEATSNAIALQ